MIPLGEKKKQAEQIYNSMVEVKARVSRFLALPAEGLIDLVIHRYTMPQLHFHVREERAFCCLASVSAVESIYGRRKRLGLLNLDERQMEMQLLMKYK